MGNTPKHFCVLFLEHLDLCYKLKDFHLLTKGYCLPHLASGIKNNKFVIGPLEMGFTPDPDRMDSCRIIQKAKANPRLLFLWTYGGAVSLFCFAFEVALPKGGRVFLLNPIRIGHGAKIDIRIGKFHPGNVHARLTGRQGHQWMFVRQQTVKAIIVVLSQAIGISRRHPVVKIGTFHRDFDQFLVCFFFLGQSFRHFHGDASALRNFRLGISRFPVVSGASPERIDQVIPPTGGGRGLSASFGFHGICEDNKRYIKS